LAEYLAGWPFSSTTRLLIVQALPLASVMASVAPARTTVSAADGVALGSPTGGGVVGVGDGAPAACAAMPAATCWP
jgi:hypothetical protein